MADLTVRKFVTVKPQSCISCIWRHHSVDGRCVVQGAREVCPLLVRKPRRPR